MEEMKMKKIFIAAVTVAAALAFSCQKNEQAPVSAQPEFRTFTCTIASDPDSKVSIANDGKTAWEVGDKILVHGKELSTSKVVTLTSADITDAGKKAIINVDVSGMTAYAPDSYYAAYPADAYIDSGSDRPYYYSRFNDTNLPLMTAYLDGDNFLFFNLCGVITFSVTGDFDDFIFSGNNNEEVGYDTYQVKVISTEKNYKRADGTSGPKTTVTGTVTGDGSTIHYIYLPAGVNFTKGFSIKFRKSGAVVKVASTDSAVNVARSKILPLGEITSHLKTYVAPTKHDNTIEVNIATATDLGSSATANCYVISSAGDYMFKAVKGNSSTVVGTVASVAILWETWNNAETVTANSVIAAADYDLQSGGDPYVVFKTPATLHVGNALIAAKDAGDNILWSWHIWVPSVAISATDKTAVIGGSVMNMNLGALEEVPGSGSATIASLGLLYQWGRKDPFVGAAEWKDYPAKAKVAGSAWTLTKSRVTMAEAILHPTVLYIDPAQSDNKGWMATPDATLWNNSGSKTIYDPCPAGYKVPVKTGSIWTKTDTDWTFDATNHVCELSGVRIPLAGYVECWGGSLYGNGTGSEHAYLWSATSHDGDVEKGDCVYIRAFRTSDKYYGDSRGKANAASVRCVAE